MKVSTMVLAGGAVALAGFLFYRYRQSSSGGLLAGGWRPLEYRLGSTPTAPELVYEPPDLANVDESSLPLAGKYEFPKFGGLLG